MKWSSHGLSFSFCFSEHKEGKSRKALWGPWLTYIEKHTHRCIFIRHIMFVCVNNPVISNCRIISTCVGSHKNTHTHTLLLTKSSTHEVRGHNAPLSALVCVCVCVLPPSYRTNLLLSWLQMILCWFSFPSHAANLLMMAWHVSEQRAACQCASHTSHCCHSYQHWISPLPSYSVQFNLTSFITVNVILIDQNFHFQIRFNSIGF